MEYNEIKAKLEEMKKQLTDDLGGLKMADPSNDEFRAYENSVEDESMESERGKRSDALSSVIEKQLGRVNRALEKLENGTYGICDSTGEPIDPERLKAMPEAIYTREAEEALERQSHEG